MDEHFECLACDCGRPVAASQFAVMLQPSQPFRPAFEGRQCRVVFVNLPAIDQAGALQRSLERQVMLAQR